jgi:hypothetical protein
VAIKSVFVSALGVLTGFFTNLVAGLKKDGLEDEQIHELLVGKRSEEFLDKIRATAREMVKGVGNGLRIVVDYSKSLAEMISAGKYDWVNSDITSKRFPVKGQGRVELNAEFVYYGKLMSSDDIVKDVKERSLRPATLSELLAFGETYPDKQREFPIVALGSVWQHWSGDRSLASLHCLGSKRKLNLCIWESVWDGCCRFLAFRK